MTRIVFRSVCDEMSRAVEGFLATVPPDGWPRAASQKPRLGVLRHPSAPADGGGHVLRIGSAFPGRSAPAGKRLCDVLP